MTIHMDIYDSIHYWNSLKFERKSICEWVQTYTGGCRDTDENCWKSCYTQNYRQDKKFIRIFYQCLDHNILYYVLELSSTWQHIRFKPQISQSTLRHIDSDQKKKTNLPTKKIQHIRIRKHSTLKCSWLSLIHLVPKDISTWHIFFNFRQLNTVTSQDWYPLPFINNFTTSLQESIIFKLDLY